MTSQGRGSAARLSTRARSAPRVSGPTGQGEVPLEPSGEEGTRPLKNQWHESC